MKAISPGIGMDNHDYLEWNVFCYNFNEKKIEKFNVFNHASFERDVRRLLVKTESKEEFSDELAVSVKYYYWAKSEWEVVITPWVGSKSAILKVDVVEQLKMNWDCFVDYTWSFKDQIALHELDPCPF